jgi:hypothetical protein
MGPDDRPPREAFDRATVRREDAAICADLALIGIDVDSIDDLHTTAWAKGRYKAAIPLLMDWMGRASLGTKQILVADLAIPEARPMAAPLLLDEFRALRDEPPSALRWQLGDALAVVTDASHLDQVVALLRDRAYGKDRARLVSALPRLNRPEARALAVESLDDPELALEAISAVRRMGETAAIPGLRRLAAGDNPTLRRNAIKALHTLEGTGPTRAERPAQISESTLQTLAGSETSMNADLEDLPRILDGLLRVVPLLTKESVIWIVAQVDEMEVDDQRFFLVGAGSSKRSDVEIGVLLDDVDAVIVSVVSAPDLIADVDDLFAGFAEDQ